MIGQTLDWNAVRLVAFDVDGTLYDQRAMRLRMLGELAANVVRTRSLSALRVLRTFRRLREAISEREVHSFDDVLMAETAQATGASVQQVRAIVEEWIHHRPLAHIRACRYPHVADVFAALKRHGKSIGVFSDYPAMAKLAALELTADLVVSADDAGYLKPHPQGLRVLMNLAGVSPAETVLIGDRLEKDGECARRAGAFALIRSNKQIAGWHTFSKYSGPAFSSLLENTVVSVRGCPCVGA
jgi:putative hydrolase of the HAD superfamily